MKSTISLLIMVFLLSKFSNCKEQIRITPEQKQKLLKLKKEVSENLTKNILPYWSAKMVDKINGGFYGRIDGNDKVYPDTEKGGILNARILWTYSSAYRVLGVTSYLRMATRAKDYILAHFIDSQFGGAYRSLKADGTPSDTRKQLYTNAFFIYSLSEYSRATGDKIALAEAMKIFDLFEKYAADREFNGYFEAFSREWVRVRDRMIGESSWLLYEAAGLLRDKKLTERLKGTGIKIANDAAEGYQHDGSMLSDKNYATTGHIRTQRSWWEQAETIVGYLNAFELTGEESYLDKSLRCWEYTKKYFIDKKNGAWFTSVSKTGVQGGDKAGFWICPYHNGRMCMEVIERVKD
jgi:mannose/cellobiose epimerase-like protein (N-acyl-D-glucosamine 2-epimerase family)